MSKFYDIFDYWKNKCITEDGEVKIEFGYDGYDGSDINKSIPVVYDWGEPSCFACGRMISINYIKSTDTLKDIWNDADAFKGFQRCHILAKSLGGSDKADNLFCMCESCHANSPDTIYPEMFFRWVYERREKGSLFMQAVKRGEKMGIPLQFYDIDDLNSKTVTSHGGMCADETIIAAYVGGAKKRYEEMKNHYKKNGLKWVE